MNYLADNRWPHRIHWMSRVASLDAAAPEKYCWAGLVSLALYGPDDDRETQNESIRCANDCREESTKTGSCYCGKFRNGSLNKET